MERSGNARGPEGSGETARDSTEFSGGRTVSGIARYDSYCYGPTREWNHAERFRLQNTHNHRVLSSILPGLADRTISQIAELTLGSLG